MVECGTQISDDRREALAEYAHEAWAGWMRWLFRFGTKQDDGSFLMDAEQVERWQRQMETRYAELSKLEKDSDRKEADAMLAILAVAAGARSGGE